MSLKPQQKIDVSHLFSNELTLFLNNASRSPLPTTHQAILQRFMTDWHRGVHEPYYYNFQHADALKNELGHFISCAPDHIAIGTNVAQSFASILHGYPFIKSLIMELVVVVIVSGVSKSSKDLL